MFFGIEELVYKPQCEDNLAQGAVKYKEMWNFSIVKALCHKLLPVSENIRKACGRGAYEGYPENEGYFTPYTLFVEIPNIYVIGNYLAQHDCKIIP